MQQHLEMLLKILMSRYKRNLLSLQRSQYILYIAVLTFVLVCVWIGMSLFTSQRTTTISAQLRELAKPLNPNIDAALLQKIEAKRTFSAEELSSFPVYVIYTSQDGRSEQIVTLEQARSMQEAERLNQAGQPVPTQQQLFIPDNTVEESPFNDNQNNQTIQTDVPATEAETSEDTEQGDEQNAENEQQDVTANENQNETESI